MKAKATLHFDGQQLQLARNAFLLAANESNDRHLRAQYLIMARQVKWAKIKFHIQAFNYLTNKYKIKQ